MSVASKILDSLGGSLVGSIVGGITNIAKSYFPPDLSPEQEAEMTLKIEELTAQKTKEFNDSIIEIDRLYLSDIQNAREQNKHSVMPSLLCSILTIGMIAFVVALMVIDIPSANQRLIDTLFGSYLTAWLGSCNYWLGTTRGSADKTKAQLTK